MLLLNQPDMKSVLFKTPFVLEFDLVLLSSSLSLGIKMGGGNRRQTKPWLGAVPPQCLPVPPAPQDSDPVPSGTQTPGQAIQRPQTLLRGVQDTALGGEEQSACQARWGSGNYRDIAGQR